MLRTPVDKVDRMQEQDSVNRIPKKEIKGNDRDKKLCKRHEEIQLMSLSVDWTLLKRKRISEINENLKN